MSGVCIYYGYMPYPRKEQRNKDLIKKFLSGLSLRELGEYFGIHHSTVEEVIDRWLPIYGPTYPKLWKEYQEAQVVKH